jgi:putative ABC transport system permease protein
MPSLPYAFHNAAKNLARNRLRTGLSLLGIVIGVFAVTVIVSLGIGIRSAISGYIDIFGKDFIQIQSQVPGASQGNSMMALLTGANSLTFDDLEAMRRTSSIPKMVLVSGGVTAQEVVQNGNREYRATIFGTTIDYQQVDPQVKAMEGRFFSDSEEKSQRLVAVLGSAVADKLFPNETAVGKKVKIGGQPVEVVGVLESVGAILGFDRDTLVYMPLRVVQKRYTGSNDVLEMYVKAESQEDVPEVVAGIERFLRRQHRIDDPDKDDFVVQTAIEIAETIDSVTKALTYLLTFLAAISLVVGGIGIMNIMLVSVTERIREVGLRKAVGAKPHDILMQFLAESVILTTVGGLIGGILGFLITMAIVFVMNQMGFEVPYVLSLGALAISAVVAAVVGVLFGIRPARKAADLDPISSLRYE